MKEEDNKIAAGIFLPDEKMLALSWKEPYGSLMLHGKIETRTWKTNYRGWVLICASQMEYPWDAVMNISGEDQFNRITELIISGKLISNPGFAIAIGKLVNCRPMSKWAIDESKCFVEYQDGLWCHEYENIHPITPFPWKGSQGWKEVSFDIKEGIQVLPAYP
jgi:hypothetical protein